MGFLSGKRGTMLMGFRFALRLGSARSRPSTTAHESSTIRTVHSDASYLSTNRDRERTMASLSKSCTAEPSNVHRLVIVEGIMGSGKSTTMRFIAKHLQ